MKVILIKDVARLGRRGEVKEVPDGHAHNFLIPRKMAIIATPEGMKRLNEEVKKHGEQKEHALEAFRGALKRLETETVVYATEANAKGSLFKGVSASDIADALQKMNITVSKENVLQKQPIKEIGMYDIVLSYGGVEGICKLEIKRTDSKK